MSEKKSSFIKRSLESLKPSIKQATLIAVSKGRTLDEIKAVYDEGVRDFGENRVTEFLEKKRTLPTDIIWHFIGSLQRNKVKKIVGEVDLIHSVDSQALAEEISREALKKGIRQSVLLQINVSREEQKHGFSPADALKEWKRLKELEGVEWKGVMTMAPLTEDQEIIRSTFRGLKKLATQLEVNELSMGMSQDYKIALEEGATMVRIGRSLFAS
jgi:PLP dependent protein